MASFRYKVLQKDGSLSEGSLEAASRGEATRRLNEQGCRILSMTEEKQKVEKKKAVKEGTPDKPAKKATTAPVENRLSSKQLVQFTEELSDLLSAGVQLDTSLHSIGKRSESPAIARVASSCYDKVRDGVPLATALRLSSPSFNELYCNLVSAGEVSEGALLNRCMEKARIFESGLVDMVRIGEDTGQLAPSMAKAGDRLDREFGRAIERIASVIQPAIILVMSLVVGLMAYMMISVIYETISVLRNR